MNNVSPTALDLMRSRISNSPLVGQSKKSSYNSFPHHTGFLTKALEFLPKVSDSLRNTSDFPERPFAKKTTSYWE